MDYFLLLLIVYMLLLVTSITVFNIKIVSPSIIFTASLTMMVYLAFATKELMEFTVSKKTFETFALSGLLFVFTESIVMLFYRTTHSMNSIGLIASPERTLLYINKSIVRTFSLLIISSLLITTISIILITGGSIGNRMETYTIEGGVLNYLHYINFGIDNSVIYKLRYYFLRNGVVV